MSSDLHDLRDVVARLVERVDRLEAENTQVKAHCAQLEAENTRLKADLPSTRSDVRCVDTPAVSAAMAPPQATSLVDSGRSSVSRSELSRRGLLRTLGGAAAGVGLAGGTVVMGTQRADAAHRPGFGHKNFGVMEGTTLFLKSHEPGLWVLNQGLGAGVGMKVTSEGSDGLYAEGNRYGIDALGPRAPLRLRPSQHRGRPTVEEHLKGELFVDRDGVLFQCVGDGTPGTWLRVGFNPLTPVRILDTREGTARNPLGTRGEFDVRAAGVADVPSYAGAVMINATASSPTADTFITIYPSPYLGYRRPVVQNLVLTKDGPPVSNLVVVGVGNGGKVRIYNHAGSVQMVLDVVGFFT